MSTAAAKLASPPIAPAIAPHAATAGASTLPSVAIMSVALHSLAALALTQLPLPTSIARDLEMTWVSFDLETPAAAPVAAIEEEEDVAPPEPLPPPPEVVHRERPRPIETPEPEALPEPEAQAPPSIDDVFAEPPPPAAVMTSEGTTGAGFAMAPGQLGGVPGGVPGGRGTSLVSATHEAAPRVDTSEADRRRARRSYVHAVEELVRAHTRYPRAAGREGLQGRVELALRIGNDGRLLAVRVATTSGHSLLDDAAIAAAREIDRMPTPPLVAALASTDEVRVGVVYLVR